MHTYGECRRCHAAIPPALAQCPQCGASTASQRTAPARGRAPVIPPAPPRAARKPKPRSRLGLGLMVAAGVALAGVGAYALVSRVSDDESSDSDSGKGKKKGKGKDKDEGDKERDGYSAKAEPAIPESAASFRVDPREIKRGDGRAVKKSAREIDKASALTYDPDKDPYCQNQARWTDIVKSVGYDIDRELRKAATMDDAEEEQIGDEVFEALSKSGEYAGKVDTPSMTSFRRYITELSVPLLASVQRKGIVYDFHTVDDDNVNAFAIPGGHIFFYRGIFESPRRLENEAQVAGVLAHEINHVDKRHTIAIFEHLKRLGELGDQAGELAPVLVNMARHPFSTKQEDEADEVAVKFLFAAEYSPKQFVTMWQTWDSLDSKRKSGSDPITDELEELINTHSHPARRACNVMRLIMTSKPKGVDRFYVGTTNYADKETRVHEQH